MAASTNHDFGPDLLTTGRPGQGIPGNPSPWGSGTSRWVSNPAQERRRRRRVAVLPMYTAAVVRVLGKRLSPLEGHVLNVSETGIAVELDVQLTAGQAVTVEFQVAGLGTIRWAGQEGGEWPRFAAAAEVVRQDDAEDFAGGPYRIALRWLQLPTMAQAQIARFVAAHTG